MSNVIQFPGKKGSPTSPRDNSPPSAPSDSKKPSQGRTKRTSQAVLSGAVLSILLATVAVNRSVFRTDSSSLSSVASVDQSSNPSRPLRDIASVAPARDPQWEKSIAERLASAEVRGPASFNIGRDVSAEEKLHFGALNGIYSLEFTADSHLLKKISLQDKESNPSYLSSDEFFRDFGLLVNPRFKSASRVGAPSRSEDRIFENYRLFDVDNRPVLGATFERDRHGRLLSMEVTALD